MNGNTTGNTNEEKDMNVRDEPMKGPAIELTRVADIKISGNVFTETGEKIEISECEVGIPSEGIDFLGHARKANGAPAQHNTNHSSEKSTHAPC